MEGKPSREIIQRYSKRATKIIKQWTIREKARLKEHKNNQALRLTTLRSQLQLDSIDIVVQVQIQEILYTINKEEEVATWVIQQ